MTTTTRTKLAAPEPDLPRGRVLHGDARQRLAELPAGSIDTVVTSPPYFQLRNYAVAGQIGAEAHVDQWVDGLLLVLAEIARVLKPSGSVWLNVGDTYSHFQRQGATSKSLLLGPERLVLALAGAGWSVRNKVVWQKANPMPTSVRDRLSSTWEPLYLLTRSPRYFFDLDAIRVPVRSSLSGPSRAAAGTKYAVGGAGRPAWSGPLAGNNAGLEALKAAGRVGHPLGKNPGDVWTMATAANRARHWAAFPETLVERPLLATCPQRVCSSCLAPWWRAPVVRALGEAAVRGALRKSCPCPRRSWQPGVVLDPFMGSGTTAVVAERLGRDWVGIELKADYVALAEQRIAAARPTNHK